MISSPPAHPSPRETPRARPARSPTMAEARQCPDDAQAADQLEALRDGLDALGSAVVLVDESARIHFATMVATAGFARAGFASAGDVLHCPRAPINVLWMAALHDVCILRRTRLLELPGQGAPIWISLSPVKMGGRPCALVAFGRPAVCDWPALEHFARRHSLTSTETQVMHRLAQGMKAADIARLHGVAVSTVMTQMAAIRTKTAAGSVRRLVQILSQLPPMAWANDERPASAD